MRACWSRPWELRPLDERIILQEEPNSRPEARLLVSPRQLSDLIEHSMTPVPGGAVFGEQTTSHGASHSFPIDRSLESFNDRDLKGLTLMGKTEIRYGPRANHAEVTIDPLGDSR
jgi:hypothetical protein